MLQINDYYDNCADNHIIIRADARLSIQDRGTSIIFSNRAASSRDIAVRFTLLEDIRLMCDGGTMTDESRYMYTILYSKNLHIIITLGLI